MDILLSKITQQAMNYAIRSGIAITSGYAIQQCSRLMKTKDGHDREQLATLQSRLDSKIRIISPAIDMIELITARGNTSLESAVSLTKALRWDIQALGIRLSRAAADGELLRRGSSRAKSKQQNDVELRMIIADMQKLLGKIEDAVPLINLAITTSGVSLSTSLPATISPSRLLQASTFLSAGDSQYAVSDATVMQIGPTFTLSLYMLFSGHAEQAHEDDSLRSAIWKEVIHKARVKVVRVPLKKVLQFPFARRMIHLTDENEDRNEEGGFQEHIPGEVRNNEFAYQLVLIEDLDDDRFHDDETISELIDDVAKAGIHDIIPIHEVSKIFYADTSKILNIGSDGETNNPVLLLKRDVNAPPPRRMMEPGTNETTYDDENYEHFHNFGERGQEVNLDLNIEAQIAAQLVRDTTPAPEMEAVSAVQEEIWRLPAALDPEWLAWEVYQEEEWSESDSESAVDRSDRLQVGSEQSPSHSPSLELGLSAAMSHLHLNPRSATTPSKKNTSNGQVASTQRQTISSSSNSPKKSLSTSRPVRTSLSLLEMLIRLTSLQQFQQCSHLAISDELLNFFLEESSTTGAAPGDIDTRKQIRMEARRRVGFDPYDESPVKRRGEAYQSHHEYNSDDGYGNRETHSTDRLHDPQRWCEESPLLLRDHEHSIYSSTKQSWTGRSQSPATPNRGTPPLVGARRNLAASATPPGTTKSRHIFLRDEPTRTIPGKGSPLARTESHSSIDMKRSKEDGSSSA